MGVQAISHEIAFATSQRVVRVFSALLREEERLDAMNEVYPLLKDALRTFAERMDRERRRLPGPPGTVEKPAEVDAPTPATPVQGD